MKLAVDLHIHSALSPCSDNEMTPNNIVNMALLKGLDIIAVTDHNSAENLEAVMKCAAEQNILAVPGMEVETSEEVHLICLFPTLRAALEMQALIYNALPDILNREDIFGEQLMMDENDHVKGKLGRMLLTATGLGMEEVFSITWDLGGVVIPAHVDRDSYSMLSNLGLIPENLPIRYLEISKNCEVQKILGNTSSLSSYKLLRSSDAHTLGDILERETFLELGDRSLEALFSELRGQGNEALL